MNQQPAIGDMVLYAHAVGITMPAVVAAINVDDQADRVALRVFVPFAEKVLAKTAAYDPNGGDNSWRWRDDPPQPPQPPQPSTIWVVGIKEQVGHDTPEDSTHYFRTKKTALDYVKATYQHFEWFEVHPQIFGVGHQGTQRFSIEITERELQ